MRGFEGGISVKKKTRKSFDNEFRNNAVRYVQEHDDLTIKVAAANLGVGKST